MNKPLLRLLPLLAVLFVAAARKEPEFSVRFYTEAAQSDGRNLVVPVQLQNPLRQSYISRIAAISETDITGIYPFTTAGGALGCAFFLDDHGRTVLDSLSVEKRGTSLIALVNGRQVIDMLIDRRIPDGIVVIPSRLSVAELAMLKQHFKIVALPSATPKK